MLRYASESGGDTFTVGRQSNPIGWAADVTYSVLSSQLQKLLELNISRATWVRRKLKLKMPRRLISPTSGSILGFRSRYRTMVKKLQTKQTVWKLKCSTHNSFNKWTCLTENKSLSEKVFKSILKLLWGLIALCNCQFQFLHTSLSLNSTMIHHSGCSNKSDMLLCFYTAPWWYEKSIPHFNIHNHNHFMIIIITWHPKAISHLKHFQISIQDMYEDTLFVVINSKSISHHSFGAVTTDGLCCKAFKKKPEGEITVLEKASFKAELLLKCNTQVSFDFHHMLFHCIICIFKMQTI